MFYKNKIFLKLIMNLIKIMSLTDLNLERYSRSILLPEIGGMDNKNFLILKF